MHSDPSNFILNCKTDSSFLKYEKSVRNCDRLVFEMVFLMPSDFPFSAKSSMQNMSRSSLPHSQAT